MVRFVAILAIAAAGLPPMAKGAAAVQSDSAACCCCPAGSCQCGCEAPAQDGEDASGGLIICGCDSAPLGMPTPGPTTDTRLTLSGVVRTSEDGAQGGVVTAPFRGHQAHGPPPAAELLSTIILLT